MKKCLYDVMMTDNTGSGMSAKHIPEHVHGEENQTLMPGTDNPADPCDPSPSRLNTKSCRPHSIKSYDF